VIAIVSVPSELLVTQIDREFVTGIETDSLGVQVVSAHGVKRPAR
jgi:hypothetical protein